MMEKILNLNIIKMIFKPESVVPIDLEYKSGEEVLNEVVK